MHLYLVILSLCWVGSVLPLSLKNLFDPSSSTSVPKELGPCLQTIAANATCLQIHNDMVKYGGLQGHKGHVSNQTEQLGPVAEWEYGLG